jgi:cell division protein FtsZ
MQFDIPKSEGNIIKVIGVGGGGSNAVTHMFKQGIVGVDFAVCNTDNQAMDLSPVPNKIQLGPELTEGRGAGSKPTVGREACLESIEVIRKFLENNTKMVFITAGMGGGTGTGAAPIVAKVAQELDILTVGIVTLPFTFEGRRRAKQATEGLEELKKNVDTIIIISNDKLRQMHGNLALSNAFAEADSILTVAAKGIAEIITVPGYINVDFEDVNTVMRGSGVAIMGSGQADGDDRAIRAVEAALTSPLLEENDIKGAQHILLNITSGTKEVTMDEIFEITEYVQEEAGFGTDLIWGNCYDADLGEKISVTVIATGFEQHGGMKKKEVPAAQKPKIVVPLDGEKKAKEDPLFEVGHNEGQSARTIEFDPMKANIDKYYKKNYSYDEPYIKGEENKRREQDENARREQERIRSERVRMVNVKLNNPQTVNEMENEPAYLRRKILLDDVPHSSDEHLSKWVITDEDEPELRLGNSFLHDNVD